MEPPTIEPPTKDARESSAFMSPPLCERKSKDGCRLFRALLDATHYAGDTMITILENEFRRISEQIPRVPNVVEPSTLTQRRNEIDVEAHAIVRQFNFPEPSWCNLHSPSGVK
jgi:hypothetical protein